MCWVVDEVTDYIVRKRIGRELINSPQCFVLTGETQAGKVAYMCWT
jgi:hypothetical protein